MKKDTASAISIGLALGVSLFSACGDNPEEFEPWPDGAQYFVGSPSPYSDSALAFSPGGNVLLFCSAYSGNPGIYGFDVGDDDDPSLRTFSSLDESTGPNGCWCDTSSSSGVGMILYTARNDDGFSDIRWMPGNACDVHTVLNDSLPHLHPTWCTTADSLVWATFEGGHWGLWRSPLEGFEPDSFFCPAADCLMPSYSPDGDWILFEYRSADNGDIWVIRPDGSDAHEVVGGSSSEMHPCWGPGDGWFVFASDRTGNLEIWIGNVGSDELIQVTDDSAVDFYPAWNPVGNWIAFSSDRNDLGESYDIFWIDPPSLGL